MFYPHVPVACGYQKEAADTLGLELQAWELDSGSLEEQQILLTTDLALWPLSKVSVLCINKCHGILLFLKYYLC